MAGGPHASVIMCMTCGHRAVRSSEGSENDTFRCSRGHGFSVHYKKPVAAPWPPTEAELASLEGPAAQALGWDLASIRDEIAAHAPPAPRPAPTPPRPPRVASSPSLFDRVKRWLSPAEPPAPPVAPAPTEPHDVAAWLARRDPAAVRRTLDHLVARLLSAERSWERAKHDLSGDDWDDFATYKACERWCAAARTELGAVELERIPDVASLLPELEAAAERARVDADYPDPRAAKERFSASVEDIRTRGPDALDARHR